MFIAAEAEAFASTQDAKAAIARLQTLGTQAEVAQLAAEVVQEANSQGDLVTADRTARLAAGVGLSLPPVDVAGQTAPGETTPTPEPAQQEGGSILPTLLGIVLLAGGIGLAAWLLLRRKAPRTDESQAAQACSPAWTSEPPTKPAAYPSTQVVDRTVVATPGAASDFQAGHEYSATFSQGDVEYDQSFDIEAPDGAYWGECGLTMSELVNGDPKRVTALEVWLFDKSDIRTVTKVLMTDYAYGNQALRDKLSSKGDALLLSPDMGFVLDAQTLRLMGKIVALEYDDSGAPPRSTLRRLSVQLRVMRQAGQ